MFCFRPTRSDASQPYGTSLLEAALPVVALLFGVLPGSMAWIQPANAAGSSSQPAAAATAAARSERSRADFLNEVVSRSAQEVADWIATSGDNAGLPFVIVDKVDARVFVFDGEHRLRGAASALLGLGRGDETVAGIGQRRLATIRPHERTTPAGRFVAALGRDFEQDILWVDYDSSLSLHRVIVGKVTDRRHARLASPTPLDNHISYGCINVPAQFYDMIVAPAFKGTVGIVYILPETKPIAAVFSMQADRRSSPPVLEKDLAAIPTR